jgi:hypothetical protein
MCQRRAALTATPEPMVPQGPGECQHLLADGTGPEARLQTAETVAWSLVRRRLALSLQAIDTAVLEAAGDGTTVYEQPAAPAVPRPAATILVVQADGAEALPQQMVTHVPEHILVLDIIHATESLWDTANALLGEIHPQRLAWIRASLEPLLAGQTDVVITALEAEGKDPTGTGTQRQAVQRTVGYSRRNRSYMRDDEYLACGGPIGTGVVEGACGHLVNDRLEQSGRRWTPGGAQAVLDLRAVRLNGPGDTYWPFHRHQHPHRLYGRSAPAPALADAQALTWVA